MFKVMNGWTGGLQKCVLCKWMQHAPPARFYSHCWTLTSHKADLYEACLMAWMTWGHQIRLTTKNSNTEQLKYETCHFVDSCVGVGWVCVASKYNKDHRWHYTPPQTPCANRVHVLLFKSVICSGTQAKWRHFSDDFKLSWISLKMSFFY